MNYEKEVMGIYLSGHPLDKVRGSLEQYITLTSDELITSPEDDETEEVIYDGKRVVVGGILIEKKVIFTKQNKKMAFLTLEDTRGTMEIVVFPNSFELFSRLAEDSIFVIKGRISIKEETNAVVLAEEITTLEILTQPKEESYIILELDVTQRTAEMREQLLHIFQKYQGKN